MWKWSRLWNRCLQNYRCELFRLLVRFHRHSESLQVHPERGSCSNFGRSWGGLASHRGRGWSIWNRATSKNWPHHYPPKNWSIMQVRLEVHDSSKTHDGCWDNRVDKVAGWAELLRRIQCLLQTFQQRRWSLLLLWELRRRQTLCYDLWFIAWES